MDVGRLSARAAERAIINFLKSLSSDIIEKLIEEDVDILELVVWLCKKYPNAKNQILAVLGAIRTFAQIHPRPNNEEVYKFIFARIQQELPKVWPLIQNGGQSWLKKNIDKFIIWIWGR